MDPQVSMLIEVLEIKKQIALLWEALHELEQRLEN